MCSALATGRRIDWSGLASSLPVPHRRWSAIDLNVLSSTVLPTPRRPVSTMDRSGLALATALKYDLELTDLPVSARELRWPLPGTGRVGVPYGVHDRTL